MLSLVVAAGGSFCSGMSARATPADLVLQNGRIVTIDDRAPEAQALASSGDKIVFVGSNADVRKYVGGSTKVIDLQGQLAIPGFIEGHGHFTDIGEGWRRASTTGAPWLSLFVRGDLCHHIPYVLDEGIQRRLSQSLDVTVRGIVERVRFR
jgi:hypothetical protein